MHQPVEVIEVFLISWRAEEVEVSYLEIRPEMTQVVAAIFSCHKWQQILLWYEFWALLKEGLCCVPKAGNSVGQLQNCDDKAIFQAVFLQETTLSYNFLFARRP